MVETWVRQGECNECGDCCRQSTSPVEAVFQETDEAYGRIRFGEPIIQRPGLMVFRARGPILSPCPMLDGDRCSIHATRPATCRDSPKTPAELEGLPRCSYTFINAETGEARFAGALPLT
jgi:Fe-S-cluster containining protein